MRKIRITPSSWEVPTLIVLFCFSISLFNLAGYIFAAMIAVMLFFQLTRLKLTATELVLILLSVSFWISWIWYNGISIEPIIIYLFGPWCAYVLGRLFVEKASMKHAFYIFVCVLAIGMLMHGVLNLIAYVLSDEFALYEHYRRSVDIWRGTVVNVNTTGMFYTFACGISLGTLFTNASKKAKGAAAAVVLLCVAMTAFFANRALLAIVLIILLWRLAHYLLSSRVPAASKLKLLIGMAVALLLIAFILAANVGGAADWLSSLKIVQRIFSEDTASRMDVWSLFFRDFKFLRYPFGGHHILEGTSLSYLHNMWLDVYDSVGCLPFVLLVVVTGMLVYELFRFHQVVRRNGEENKAIVMQSLMIAVFANCMVEPILEANPYYALIVLMFFGAMRGYRHRLGRRPAGERV